jgi:hypothetical protein
MSTNHVPAQSPIALQPTEGEALWFMGFLATIKASAEETGADLRRAGPLPDPAAATSQPPRPRADRRPRRRIRHRNHRPARNPILKRGKQSEEITRTAANPDRPWQGRLT